MTIKELIQDLQAYDQEAVVLFPDGAGGEYEVKGVKKFPCEVENAVIFLY